ncbi:MAG TPA: adenylyltransferase/cytidyltransferase family protein [Candidatus Sulfopaludibacter sp.]|jgi:nicotinate-nucleotide adenylyltransferase|nr:adenylyltransferase/cytidyltransferase family protein [Candidatus Sulfopaludibacter sp.]
MKFFQRADRTPVRIGILPGTFNPVTVAHLALAQAALSQVDEVVFVMPQVLPHKTFIGASFDERIQMLRMLLPRDSPFSIATSAGGLFREIAAEYRIDFGPEAQLTFLCGRDAAERIASWDYGDPGAFQAMLREFNLLVAARHGEYEVPGGLQGAIAQLELRGDYDHVSSSEVRQRIKEAKAWEHLVPAEIHDPVRRIYG